MTLSDDTTIDVTPAHLFWSQSRRDWIAAGDLEIGEELNGLGDRVWLVSKESLGSTPRVYNLEVHGEHVYRVAHSGVLVHNAYAENVPGIGLSRGAYLRQKYAHLSPEQRAARIAQRGEDSAKRWVEKLEQRLGSHFVEKHAPDIPLRPNLARRSIDGSHPRTGAPGDYAQPSSQFVDWRTQMHALNEAMTREARGLPVANYYINGNANLPAVLGTFGGRVVGRGFTRTPAT